MPYAHPVHGISSKLCRKACIIWLVNADTSCRAVNDNALRLAFFIFWGGFLASMYLAYISPSFAEELLGMTNDEIAQIPASRWDFAKYTQAVARDQCEQLQALVAKESS